MRVKVGELYFDSDMQPILLTLSREEKEKIATLPYCKNFCCSPEEWSEQALREFTNDPLAPKKPFSMVPEDDGEIKG
jgi:hypothetical protein